MIRVVILWLFGWAFLWGAADGVVLSQGGEYFFDNAISYYEDSSSERTFSEVRKARFTPYAGNVPSFGFSSSSYWFKVRLLPDIKAAEHIWWLKLDYPLLDYIDLYVLDDNGELLQHKRGGELRPFALRELNHRHHLFLLPPAYMGPFTLYVRVQTSSAVQVPMTVMTSQQLIETQQFTLLAGFYYGIFVIILLYNTVLYFYTRETNYLLYLLFLNSYIVWQLTLDGLGIQYLWSEWRWMIEHGGTFLMALLALTSLWFGRSFLQTAHYMPRTDRFIFGLMLFSALMMMLSLFLPYAAVVPICASLAVVVPVVLLSAGIAVLRKDYRPARFYVIGWSAFFLGSFIFALNKFNLFPGYYLLNHAQQFGSAMEMLFLSWALADRIQLLQAEYVEKLSSLNQTLKEKLKAGLDEAREKDQMLIEQSRLAAMGEMIEQIAHQWRQPLNTMALINQDLYFKIKFGNFKPEDIEQINEQYNRNLQYMSKTIDDFRNFYKSEKSRADYDIETIVKGAVTLSEAALKYAKVGCHIHTDGSYLVHTIKNELIQVFMNILKNARDVIEERGVSDGRIDITIAGGEEEVSIVFEDNGGGIDPAVLRHIFDAYFTTKSTERGTGIGLYMSKVILEKHLSGRIHAENAEEGARFVVTLPAYDGSSA